MALLFVTLIRFELSAKMTKAQISRLRRALDSEAPVAPASRIAPCGPRRRGFGLMPALPIDEAGKYVAGAYVVFLVLLLIYVAIMAAKLDRMQRDLTELADLAESRKQEAS